jgi:cell division protein FtsI/penicillin-binding protein 2
VIDRRVGVLFGVFVLLLLVALARAGYLGLYRSGALRAAATSQQVQTTLVPAVRGEITDRNGVVFALSEPADNIVADPELITKTYKDPQAVADKLAPLLGTSTRARCSAGLARATTVTASNTSSTVSSPVSPASEIP